LLLLLAASVHLSAHASSVSYAQFTIEPQTVRGVIRIPLDDVDLMLRLDRDLDGQVSPPELEAAHDTVQRYVATHVSIAADGVARPALVGGMATWRDAAQFEYLEVQLSSDVSRRPAVVSIHSEMLVELYPGHKTIGTIRVGAATEQFVFDRTSRYERRLARDRLTTWALTIGSLLALATLWMARRFGRVVSSAAHKHRVCLAVATLGVATAVCADVIMSAAGLNTTLKTMERLTRQIASDPALRAADLFQLGVEADGLAALMNQEVESHGMQERELLDLALVRTRELGIAIAYSRGKKKFFYDGAAFAEYLKLAPRGPHAADAEFQLLSYSFYQSLATDVAALTAAADATGRFLARYPDFRGIAEVRLYLAVDYRDLSREYRSTGDAVNARKYERLARSECERIVRRYPRTDQADAARQLLAGLR
jgi:hypothetical protein